MESVKGAQRGESDPENLSRGDFLEEGKIQLSCSHVNESRGGGKKKRIPNREGNKQRHTCQKHQEVEENYAWM